LTKIYYAQFIQAQLGVSYNMTKSTTLNYFILLYIFLSLNSYRR